MSEIKQILNRYELAAEKYTLKGSTTIVDTPKGQYAFKKRAGNDLKEVYEYLKTRDFNYYPSIYNEQEKDAYYMTEYVREVNMPPEQKAIDLMKLIALLHNKTTLFKEVDLDKNKEIYETTLTRIDYLNNFYNDINTIIDSKIYMSPSEYLLARNVTSIYSNLSYCRKELDKWYKIIKDSRKQRLVTVHNNLELDHFVKNEKSYLISFEKAKFDLPIYDFLNFYKRHYLELDLTELYRTYTSRYPLRDEEKSLLFVLLSIPQKFEFIDDEYQNCKQLNAMLEYISKTDEFIRNVSQEKQETN